MSDIAELLDVYTTGCAKAGVEPLTEDEIEAYLRAVIANAIIDDATLH